MKDDRRRMLSDAAVVMQFARRFKKDEDGTMTIFALYMIFIMMMVCGIGVDMMRHEMERTRIQAISDRAVLAAADLDRVASDDPNVDREQDAKNVVIDYFAKANMSEFLNEDSIDVQGDGINDRSVTLESGLTFPTMFMDYLGVEELNVGAVSSAREVVPNIEIALVLDISYSMSSSGKLDALQDAATDFIDTVLADEVVDTTRVTLIPYGGQVNPGAAMFSYLQGQAWPLTPLDESLGGLPLEDTYHSEATQQEIIDAGLVMGNGTDPNTYYVYPNITHCLETQADGFTTIGLPSMGLTQTPHFHAYGTNHVLRKKAWCPYDVNRIQYYSNNRGEINDTIEAFELFAGTGTQYAMKWAVDLLDPVSATAPHIIALKNANYISDDFIGTASYADEETSKFIVLMTDGQISHQYRPSFGEEMNTANPETSLSSNKSIRRTESGKNTGFSHFQSQCNLAKTRSPRPITIFTIAFETSSSAGAQMQTCASTPGHYFNANLGNIGDTFDAIARQLNQLRLTQ